MPLDIEPDWKTRFQNPRGKICGIQFAEYGRKKDADAVVEIKFFDHIKGVVEILQMRYPKFHLIEFF